MFGIASKQQLHAQVTRKASEVEREREREKKRESVRTAGVEICRAQWL